jgi:hypothetical protein
MDLPDLPTTEAAIVRLTNAFRAENRLQPVKPNETLRRAAQAYADHLARSGQFSHSADGRQPADRARAAGYEPCQVAENLAVNLDSRGFRTEELARRAVEGWKNSAGHRRNMLAPSVTDIGIGIAKAPQEPKYISVQLFGRPLALAYRFKIENGTDQAVRYQFQQKEYQIAPRYVVTHTSCQPGTVRFDGAALPQAKASFTASDGTVYRLTTDQRGALKVEVAR